MKKIASILAAAVASVLFARDMPINNGVLVNDLDADGNCIRNVASPSRPGDAANKEYVDSHAGGGVDTNAVRDIVNEQLATNGIRSVDGAARPLPKYLHALDFADSYPADAAEYYAQRGSGVSPLQSAQCSSVRSGGFLSRNFDFPFDDRAEFVVRMSASTKRFASVGVAQVGTNLTEQFVTSGRPSRCYKWLPGATVDGINENGVACNINVVDGDPQWGSGVSPLQALHPLAAIRWILDNATNALHAATYIASHIVFPPGWTQNYHYMIADESSTYIVENGTVTDGDEYHEPDEPVTMTNFQLSKFPWDGMGMERFGLLLGGANITNVWYTNAYRRETTPPWVSDLAEVIDYTNEIFNAWAAHPKEYFRGKTTNGQPWWQSVHTSVYDITNRVLRVAVQEVDDWYVFQVPSSGGGIDESKVRELASEVVAPVAAEVATIPRITESVNNPGNALIADNAEDANYANEAMHASTATYADAADAANFAQRAEGIGDASSYILLEDGEFTVEDSVNPRFKLRPPSSTDSTFTNAVLQTVILGLSTNITAEVYIAATNACANLGIDPALIPGAGTTGTVGGFIVIIFTLVLWMKRKIFDNSGKVNDTFAGELFGKPVAISAIDARLPYPLNTDGTIKDRAINVVTSGAFVIPQGFHDLLIRYTGVITSLTFTGGEASYGDNLPTDGTATSEYLITVTKIKSGEAYVRIIGLEARS